MAELWFEDPAALRWPERQVLTADEADVVDPARVASCVTEEREIRAGSLN